MKTVYIVEVKTDMQPIVFWTTLLVFKTLRSAQNYVNKVRNENAEHAIREMVVLE